MASKNKALIILTPGFPENEADSTCIPPQQIFVKALKEVAPHLQIIVLTFQYPFFSKTYNWHGVKVISFGNATHSRVLRRFTGLRVWLQLRRLHEQYHIIGLLSFWLGKCAYIGSWFARKNNLSHYTWILGQDAKAGNKYFVKAKPNGNSLIALSDFIAREFHKNYGIRPAHVVTVGIDTTLFGNENHERHIDIIGVGSLITLKQYHLFLKIIGRLKEDMPHIKAVICGDGQEMEKLKLLAGSLDLENNVLFSGRLPHQEVLAMMQHSKSFLHPSNYEGFGAVCLEALYAGCQVVSFVKPMDAPIPNWHIADDINQMVSLLKDILSMQDPIYQPVLPYTIQANALAMLQIINQSDAATSLILPAIASNERLALK